MALAQLLAPLQIAHSPFAAPGAAARGELVRWVAPQLVCEVGYLERLAEGRLRHPVWRGLRPEAI